GSSVAVSCGVGCRCGSDPVLLWLWRRPAAAAPIGPLAWEPPCATGVLPPGFSAPNPVRNLGVETQTTSSITLRWEVPEGPDPQGYTYWVQCTGDGGTSETRSTTNTSVSVEGLEPGTLYEFSVWAEANGVPGSNQTLNSSTGEQAPCPPSSVLPPGFSAPNPVRNLGVETQTTSSITLRWEVPEGPDPQGYTYWVQCTGDGGTSETRSTTNTSVSVEGLEPGTLYEFSVWAEANGVPGSNQTLNSSTGEQGLYPEPHGYQWDSPGIEPVFSWILVRFLSTEPQWELQKCFLTSWLHEEGLTGPDAPLLLSVPNAVTSLRVEDWTNSSLTLSWTAPQGPPHPPYTYSVSWVEEGTPASGTRHTLDTRVVLELEAGSLYTFTVWAERNGASSDNRTLTGATAPSEVTGLQNETQTSTSVTLQWEAPADPHSQLYVFWVQWVSGGHPQGEQGPQGRQANQTGKTNETRFEVEALEPGTLYNFSVWAERNNVASSTRSLRASTAPDPVTITSCSSASGGYKVVVTWSCPPGGYEAFELEVGRQRVSQPPSSCGKGVSMSGLGPAKSYPAVVTTLWDGMRAQSASVTCHTESAGVIAGAIIGVLLLLILVGLLVFFLKRRHEKKIEKRQVPRDLVFSFPGDILAEDFADHVRKNEKDSCCGFAEEYQQLALEDHSQSQMVASAPENSAKNRYRNVLPYDWSRVPLTPLRGEPGSEYINASFIPGLWSPQEFIAAQGPLPQTVGDFWRLVWEQQSHTLVMLTNCVESGRVKCAHYWPLDAQPCTHGHLQVTLVAEEATENWTVRDMKLRHMQEQKALSVRQFHFVTWPDHGVPHSPDPLLAFWKKLRQWLDQSMGGGPPIVHCSAGVGRTGTLIALDVLLRQLECEGLVGPFSYVRKMRESRPLMVQTEAQYVFLHQCILRFLQQSSPAPVKKGAIYENLSYENAAATEA
uniref:Receptor-type tyrosine-protein phosphatase H n=2 Tax=Sus scrofa TaxID=9823 RepID=A0A5G2RFV5_PIG